jgi:hypothetical protein
MNANQSFRWVRGAVLVAVVSVCLSAGVAHAQRDVLQGTFTLPFDVQWGGATLPAGDYSFTLRSTALPAIVHIRQGTRNVALVMSNGKSERKWEGASALIVTGSGDRARIRALHSAELGMDFYYGAPKWEGPEMASAPELTQRIPISRTGK